MLRRTYDRLVERMLLLDRRRTELLLNTERLLRRLFKLWRIR